MDGFFRPDEIKFSHAVDHIGIDLAAASDADRTFDAAFITPDGEMHYCDAKRTALIHKDNLKEVCDVKHGRGHAVKEGDKAKYNSYKKAISNLDDKAHRIHFATTDSCGNLSKSYDKLVKMVPRIQHPGVGIDGSYDVDGLRSMAVAFGRRTVAAGVWRSNYKTITLWVHRPAARSRKKPACPSQSLTVRQTPHPCLFA